MDENTPHEPKKDPEPPSGAAIPPMTPAYEASPPKTSGLAIASLVVGIISFLTFGITSIIGLVMGIIALAQINRNKESKAGLGLAIAGVVTSGAAMILILPMAAIMFPVFAKAREQARTAWCLSNVKQLGLAMQMYASENDDHLPPSASWTEAASPYIKSARGVWRCPSAHTQEPCYAMNWKLNKADINTLPRPQDTVMIFESVPGRNQVGGIELLPSPLRHDGRENLGFADGHVRAFMVRELTASMWDLKHPGTPASEQPFDMGPPQPVR